MFSHVLTEQVFWKLCKKRRNGSKSAISPFPVVFTCIYPFGDLTNIFMKFIIVVCTLLEVWKSLKFFVWESNTKKKITNWDAGCHFTEIIDWHFALKTMCQKTLEPVGQWKQILKIIVGYFGVELITGWDKKCFNPFPNKSWCFAPLTSELLSWRCVRHAYVRASLCPCLRVCIRKLFLQKTSPQKLLPGFLQNFTGMFLRWSSFKFLLIIVFYEEFS